MDQTGERLFTISTSAYEGSTRLIEFAFLPALGVWVSTRPHGSASLLDSSVWHARYLLLLGSDLATAEPEYRTVIGRYPAYIYAWADTMSINQQAGTDNDQAAPSEGFVRRRLEAIAEAFGPNSPARHIPDALDYR